MKYKNITKGKCKVRIEIKFLEGKNFQDTEVLEEIKFDNILEFQVNTKRPPHNFEKTYLEHMAGKGVIMRVNKKTIRIPADNGQETEQITQKER